MLKKEKKEICLKRKVVVKRIKIDFKEAK